MTSFSTEIPFLAVKFTLAEDNRGQYLPPLQEYAATIHNANIWPRSISVCLFLSLSLSLTCSVGA
jgi:hypothetical protein